MNRNLGRLVYTRGPFQEAHIEENATALTNSLMAVFINSVLKGSPCLTNVADAAFAAYFVHNISAVNGWNFISFVAEQKY